MKIIRVRAGLALPSCRSRMQSGLLFLLISLSGVLHANTFSFVLESQITVPPAEAPNAAGTGTFTLDEQTGVVSGSVTVSGTTGQPTAAHVHFGAVGEAGPIVVALESNVDGSVWSLPADATLSSIEQQYFNDGTLYINVHTEANAPGELRAQLDDSTLVMQTTLSLTLDSESTVPSANAPGASGTGTVVVDTVTGMISGTVNVTGTTGQPTVAHVHQGAVGEAGPVVLAMTGNEDGSTWSIPEGSVLDAAGIEAFLAGNLYINVHTEANAPGELRAQLTENLPETLSLILSPDVTVPPADAPGASGTGSVTVDTTTGAISGSVEVSGTTGQPTVAHVHVGAPGEAGPVLISLDANDDGSVWTIPEGSALDAVAIQDFLDGNLYINVHTEANAPGELRAQLANSSTGSTAIALGLMGEVYSSTALELFWDRQPATAVLYRVEQSGADTVEVDGTSLFVQGLAANTTFEFTVTALDASGNELVTESIELTTNDDAFASVAVENLSGEVYSSSAIELFWDVSGDPIGTLFVISRDGVEIAVNDGRSFFEEGLASGTTFSYTVAPQSGGPSASIELTTRDDNAASTGALNLSGQVYSVSALELFWQRVDGATLYRVERDGALVVEFDALSFFDNELAAGTGFSYSVSAVSDGGEVIATETIELSTAN